MSVIKNARQIETEIKSESKIDLNLLKKKGNPKTFKGLLIQKMKEARKYNNLEVCQLLQWCYKEYLRFETSERFRAEQWRGKSGVHYQITPDIIYAIRYRKKDIGEKPQEVKTALEKEEINKVRIAIYKLNKILIDNINRAITDSEGTANFKKSLIETSEIAEETYGEDWAKVFSTRTQHIKLTEILGWLEHEKEIKYYRSGKVEVLK